MNTFTENATSTRPYSWWIPPLAALASGGLMIACYHPLNLHWLAWFALVPWLIVAPGLDSSKVWLYGTLLALLFYRTGFSWLCTISGPLGVFVILALSLWMGLSFRVATLISSYVSPRLFYLLLPFTFTAQEILRCEGLDRYRVAYLAFGYSQSHNLWIAQIASIGGVYLVTFALLAVNSSLAHLINHRSLRGLIPLGAVSTSLILLAFLSQPPDYTNEKTLPVACVQAEDLTQDEFVDLTRTALEANTQPAIVVLPEHTIYDIADEHHQTIASLAELAGKHQAYICVGAHTPAAPGSPCPFDNTCLLINPSGNIQGAQPKAVPVPFFIEDGNPATSHQVVDTPYGKIGMCICYDATFTDIPRRLVNNHAELLLVPVMDPQHWPQQQCYLHADMATFRSIELRRSAVRAASSGVSQIVWPDGSIQSARTRAQGAGTLSGNVLVQNTTSFFVSHGHLAPTLLAWLYLLTVALLTAAHWLTSAYRFSTIRMHP